MLPPTQTTKPTFTFFINVNSNKSRQNVSPYSMCWSVPDKRIPMLQLATRCPAVVNGRHEVKRERNYGHVCTRLPCYHAAAVDTEHLHSNTQSPSAQILTTGRLTFSGSGCREGGEFIASHITKAVIHTGCSSNNGPVIANLKLLPRCSWEKVAWSHTIWCSVWQAAALQENWSLKGRISSIGLINASVI